MKLINRVIIINHSSKNSITLRFMKISCWSFKPESSWIFFHQTLYPREFAQAVRESLNKKVRECNVLCSAQIISPHFWSLPFFWPSLFQDSPFYSELKIKQYFNHFDPKGMVHLILQHLPIFVARFLYPDFCTPIFVPWFLYPVFVPRFLYPNFCTLILYPDFCTPNFVPNFFTPFFVPLLYIFLPWFFLPQFLYPNFCTPIFAPQFLYRNFVSQFCIPIFGPLFLDPDFWTLIFGPQFLDPHFWTPIFGYPFSDPHFWTPIFWAPFLGSDFWTTNFSYSWKKL